MPGPRTVGTQGLADDSHVTGQLALVKLRDFGLRPSPQAYHVAYAYVTGSPAAIRRDVDALLAEGGRLDVAEIERLYARHLDVGGGRRPVEAGGELDRLRGEIAGLKQAMGDLRGLLADARAEADLDGLTGLVNRRGFMARLASAVEAARGPGRSLGLLLCEIEGFEQINEEHGYDEGDSVLREVAVGIAEHVGSWSDVARLRGYQFGVALPGADPSAAMQRAKALRGAVAGLAGRGAVGRSGGVTLSIGVAGLRSGDTAASLLERAGTALRYARQSGGGKTVSDREIGTGRGVDSLSTLVVHPDPVAASALTVQLRKAGVGKVATVASAEAGLRLFGEKPVDLVVCAAELSGMDGLELAVRVRAGQTVVPATLPMVVVMARWNASWARAAREAGVNDLLVAPVPQSALTEAVRNAVFDPRPFIRSRRYVGPDRRSRPG